MKRRYMDGVFKVNTAWMTIPRKFQVAVAIVLAYLLGNVVFDQLGYKIALFIASINKAKADAYLTWTGFVAFLVLGVIAHIFAEDQLERHERSITDPLTGLPNRRMLEEEGKRTVERARRYGDKIGVLFVDLKNFGTINNRYGHHVGDLAIQEAASILQSAVEGYLVARYGGDEFVVLCTSSREAGLKEIERRFESLFQDVTVHWEEEENNQTHYRVAHFSADVGLCVGSASESGVLKRLLVEADKKMYAMKYGENNTAGR